MTDNVTVQTGIGASLPAGTAIATDNIAGLNYQRIKPTFGVDGTATDVSTTSPLPVYGSVSPTTQWTVTTTPSSQVTNSVSPTTQWTVTTTPSSQVTNSVSPTTQWTVTTTPSSVATVALSSGTAALGTVTLSSGTAALGTVAPSLKTTSSLTNVVVSSSSSGENTLISGTAAQTIRAFRGTLQTLSSAVLSIMDATGGTTLAQFSMYPSGSINFDSFESGEPTFVTASSGALIVNLDTAVQLRGFVQYTKS